MNKQFIKGLFVGLIAPIVAFVIYVAFYLGDDVVETYNSLVKMNKLTHVISLSALINLLLFFMNLKTNRDMVAKGIILKAKITNPSNFRSNLDLNNWLIKKDIVGIQGIDTRSITSLIRDKGYINGMIVNEKITDKEKIVRKKLRVEVD